MSRKLHIYCHTEWEVSTIDAPLSDVSWSLVVMVVELAWFLCWLLSSNCQLSGCDLQKIITLCRAFANYFYKNSIILFIVPPSDQIMKGHVDIHHAVPFKIARQSNWGTFVILNISVTTIELNFTDLTSCIRPISNTLNLLRNCLKQLYYRKQM